MGTFMQSVGAAWLTVSLGAGPTFVALTQTASTLPFFLMALPAGAIGDIVDRRKLILFTEAWMAAVALVLTITTFAGLMSSWLLLTLTFALSAGDALETPTWRALLPELVGKADLPAASALNASSSTSLARSDPLWPVHSSPRLASVRRSRSMSSRLSASSSSSLDGSGRCASVRYRRRRSVRDARGTPLRSLFAVARAGHASGGCHDVYGERAAGAAAHAGSRAQRQSHGIRGAPRLLRNRARSSAP
jgi:hypothetical protein